MTASRQTRIEATGPTALKISNNRPSLTSGAKSPTYNEAEWNWVGPSPPAPPEGPDGAGMGGAVVSGVGPGMFSAGLAVAADMLRKVKETVFFLFFFCENGNVDSVEKRTRQQGNSDW